MAPARRKHKVPMPSNKEPSILQSTNKIPEPDQSSAPESSLQSTSNTATELTTPTGFNRLPFDCLLHIFGDIPLQTLIPLRRFSRACNNAIMYICARKKRLTLAPYSPPAPLGNSAFDLYWIDDLSRYLVDRAAYEHLYEYVNFPINKLTKRSIVGLSQLFSSLTELRIHFDCHKLLQSYLANIECLFQGFSCPNLTVLSFILSSNQTKSYSKPDYMDVLCKIVESKITSSRFPHLKQLDLFIADNYNSDYSLYSSLLIDFQAKPSNNILGQLKRFSLGYNNWDSYTRKQLSKLGPNLVSLSLDCKELQVDLFADDGDDDDDMSALKYIQFQSSLTHLRLSITQKPSNYDFIQSVCENFQALKFLQLQIGPYLRHGARVYEKFLNDFDDEWIGPLSTLVHLSELRLHDFVISQDGNSASLPRVKKLTLCKRDLKVRDEKQFARTVMAQFPNLEELVLVCRPFVGLVNERTRAQEAMQQMRQQFHGLRTTVFDFTAPEWTK